MSPAGELLPPNKEILNLEEAADYLGVSTKTFQKVLRDGEIPGRKVGREWKFSRRALENWVAGGRCRDFLDATDGTGGENGVAPTAPRLREAAERPRGAAGKTGGDRAFEAEED